MSQEEPPISDGSHRLLNELTNAQAVDYIAVKIDGESPTDQADRRGVTGGTVRSNVADAIEKLNELLEQEADDDAQDEPEPDADQEPDSDDVSDDSGIVDYFAEPPEFESDPVLYTRHQLGAFMIQQFDGNTQMGAGDQPGAPADAAADVSGVAGRDLDHVRISLERAGFDTRSGDGRIYVMSRQEPFTHTYQASSPDDADQGDDEPDHQIEPERRHDLAADLGVLTDELADARDDTDADHIDSALALLIDVSDGLRDARSDLAPATDIPPQRPDAPDELAAYVTDGLERQDADKLRLIAQFADELADHREWQDSQPLDPDEITDDSESLVASENTNDGKPGKIYWLKVPCGKPTCTKCPHGPYAYRKWRDGDKVRSEYLNPQPERPSAE